MRPHNRRTHRRNERGAALVIAILVLAILTVIGIALMLITSTEARIAANEWSINRGYYSADSGIRWGTVELNSPQVFLNRPEFGTKGAPIPFGSVLFNMPSHRFIQTVGFLTATNSLFDEINVSVTYPGRLGRRHYRGGIINEQGEKAQFMYAYELRSTGAQNSTKKADGTPDTAVLQYSKALVADVEVGPLPARLPF